MNLEFARPSGFPSSAAAEPLWRRLFGRRRPGADNTPPQSARIDWTALHKLLEDTLHGDDGEAAARQRIESIVRLYQGADDGQRARWFAMLCDEFAPPEAPLRRAIDDYLAADGGLDRTRAQEALRGALDSPRLRILRQFNRLPDGVNTLVRMRADLLRLDRQRRFQALDQDLLRLFESWFDVGFLELRRIGWQSPAALLEKLIEYEAVHEITSWTDLRNRLDSDRRCYAFFHPRMPDEPLIFVEVALLEQVADSVQTILDESQPTLTPESASVAIFYSISNAQAGLRGVSLGEFLIKRVVEQLMREYPRLRTFATLSPVPGLMRWLEGELSSDHGHALIPATLHDVLHAEEAGQRVARLRQALQDPPKGDSGKALSQWLQGQGARYLLETKSGREPLDPVARFHFSNGASLARIHWMADTSVRGLRQSGGLMVNYLYRLDHIERNHDAYARDGVLASTAAVRRLLGRREHRAAKARHTHNGGKQ